MKLTLSLATAAAAALVAAPALADEVWYTDGGTITYVADVGYTAVLLMPWGGGQAKFYIDGLAGNADDRTGAFHAYWIAPDEGVCDSTLTGVDGFSSSTWGYAEVHFDSSSYPTGFTAYMGECDTGFSWEMRANAM